MPFQFRSALVILAVLALGWAPSCAGQNSQQGSQSPDPPSAASLSGSVVDQSGAVIAGARVTLLLGEQTPKNQSSADQPPSDQPRRQEILSGADGQFFFPNVAPGPFQLTVTSAGFEPQTSSGILHAGEVIAVPKIAHAVATNITDVEVGVPREEIAEEQIKLEEKQRIFGAIPNFYVSYLPHAEPLTPRQKFELAWKSLIDPVTFAVVGGTAGVQQAQDHFQGYGQGAQGYAKRFGANYADAVSGTFIGGAILPSLLKQDPRYFYKGTGSRASRALYAISMSFICKGDNGRWQPNYSGILGALAAGGISNIYYPAQDRNGAELTFENAGVGIASNAVVNLFQEFIIKKLTPKVSKSDPGKP